MYQSFHDVVSVQWKDGNAHKQTRQLVIQHHAIDHATGKLVEVESEITLFAHNEAPIQLVRAVAGIREFID